MKKGRRNHSSEFKAKIALEAVKGIRTVADLASSYKIHPSQITQWKKLLQTELPKIFSQRKDRDSEASAALQSELFQEIGKLQMELQWLKKKGALLG